MGTYKSVYIGTYIKYKDKFTDSVKVDKINTCCNEKCDNYEKSITDNFCQFCGQEVLVKEVSKNIKRKISHWDILSNYGDDNAFYQPEENILIPNKGSKDFRLLNINVDIDEYGEVKIPNIDASVFVFREEFKDFLIFLDTYIDYEIKFGMVVSYS